ncbi:hypothetical protein QOZ80_5AG0391240 [Eleusine coracana subsp. coracana]|nr:hypothetical protein QOZ80_5AG0391240 [Eleusine coracana subsp. coracana]
MANEFRGKVLKCARDRSANHVIQKCMECVPPQHIQFIFKSFYGKAKRFSTSAYGCRIIQKLLTFCNNPEIYDTIVSEILEAVVELASDPFGNYVVQYIIEHGGAIERSTIVDKLVGHVLNMSYQKFASNVIEKSLTFGSFQDRQLITTEILATSHCGQFEHLLDMMCHEYANFVIQKLVMTAEVRQLYLLVEVAHGNVATIMRYRHGRNVLACMRRVLMHRGISSAGVAIPRSFRARSN